MNRAEYNAEYWKKNKKIISEKRKKKYREDKGKREEILKKHKQWVEENRERWNAYQREYRRRKKEAKNDEI